jgi:hypothetical protein
MNEQTFGTKQLIRTVVLAAFIAMLALTTTQRARASQSGSDVNDAVQFQAALCRAAGGTATIEETRTVGSGLSSVTVKCTGGYLDGMWCNNDLTGATICTFDRTVQSETEHVAPDGGVEEPQIEPIETPATTDEAAEPGPAEEPVAEQPETVEESVDPDVAEEPATDDGPVIDLPETVDEAVDPVVAEEPVIEQIPTTEQTTDPGIVVGGSYEVVTEITWEEQEPVVLE